MFGIPGWFADCGWALWKVRKPLLAMRVWHHVVKESFKRFPVSIGSLYTVSFDKRRSFADMKLDVKIIHDSHK